MNDDLNEDPDAPEEEEELPPELSELAKEASSASDLNRRGEERDTEHPDKTNEQRKNKPSNSEPSYREIKQLLDCEHPEASGARLLFRLGKLVCNLPLEKKEDRVWQVGRDGNHLDLALPNPAMSRRHFQIRYEKAMDEFLIADRQSHNGTFHNRRRLEPEGTEELLGRGDWVLAGGHIFVFVDDDETNY